MSDVEQEVLAAAAGVVAAFGGHRTEEYFACFAPQATFLFHTHPEVLPSRQAYREVWQAWERDGFRVVGCRSLQPSVLTLDDDHAVFTHRVRTRLGTPAGAEEAERETMVFARSSTGSGSSCTSTYRLTRSRVPRARSIDEHGRATTRVSTGWTPDAMVVPRYAGPDTFARLPRLSDVGHADIAVLGVPFDSGVSYRPGARFGPGAVRAGSKLLRPYHPALDIEPWKNLQVADAGDAAANPFDLVEAITAIETAADETYRSADRLVTIGGDHTIALPLLRAAHRRHGPIALVHFDAHLDTWDTYFGAPYTHGTPFRRASEEGLLALDHASHVGTRGPLYSRQDLEDDRRLGFATVSTDDIARRGIDEAIDRIRDRVGTLPVYLSIDIDVLDPSHAPGTGTPEPGGLTSRELQMILRGLADLTVIGADVVEVAPAYDHAELTSIAAANVVYEYLAMFARTPAG